MFLVPTYDNFYSGKIRVNEKRNILHEIRKRKANWIGHILRRNCLLKQVIEEKIKGEMEVARRRGRRCKKLLDDLKDRRGYYHLKEEALDRTMWKHRFGGGFGPVVRQNTEWMKHRYLKGIWRHLFHKGGSSRYLRNVFAYLPEYTSSYLRIKLLLYEYLRPCYMSRPILPPWLSQPLNTLWKYKPCSNSICNFLQSPISSSLLLRPKYRFIHKSLRDFRTRLRNNQDRLDRKEHINR